MHAALLATRQPHPSHRWTHAQPAAQLLVLLLLQLYWCPGTRSPHADPLATLWWLPDGLMVLDGDDLRFRPVAVRCDVLLLMMRLT
jgi:hypothetical protein